MRDFVDFFAAMLGMVAFLALTFWALQSWSCAGYQDTTGKPTKLNAFTCYIQDGSAWYAWEEYKYRLAAKGDFVK